MSLSALPRVTYTNIAADFGPLHAMLDRAIPAFQQRWLGRDWSSRVGARSDDEGRRYPVVSPIDRNIALGSFVEAAPAAVGRAVGAAAATFPRWSSASWQERVRLMRRVADLLDQRKYDLGIACLIEVGKSRLEAIGEAEEAVDLVRYYCDEMERNGGFSRPLARAFPHEETRDMLKPYGAFGVIAPFNFPLALSVNMMSGALIAGNTVVYKPSPAAGLTGSMLIDVMSEAGLPDGVVNLVCGGAEVGRALTDDPRIAGIALTGSYAAGMEILRKLAAGRHARPLIVEMGGKNPTYVTARADVATAATGVMRSAFGLQGQKCSAGSKVYVANEVRAEFLQRLVDLSQQIKVGDPRQANVYMGPVIDGRAAARFDDATRAARSEGAVLLGGARLTGGLFDQGPYVAPTIVADLPRDHWINRDELFLPFLSVLGFDDLGEAIADGNRIAFGLTAGVYSEDEKELDFFFDRAEAGVLYANRASGATTGAWPGVQSFAGWKGSGGASGKGGLGPYYLQQFVREQSHTIMRKA
ncbi:MAG: aldehyde dehydrogenase family protein [Alphaproteobacteria bacterium]|nr:aldehyde dehydrogenase family protein [Alphaproteobacteria bacterium]